MAAPRGNDNDNVPIRVKNDPMAAPQMPASSGSRESPAVKKVTLKTRLDPPLGHEAIEPLDLLVRQPPVRLRARPVDVSLVKHVVVVVGGHPQLGFDAYQRGILQGHTAKLEDGSSTDQLGDIPPVPSPFTSGKSERTDALTTAP